MGVTTIEWTSTRLPDGTIIPGYTFNPWRGCTKVSPACENCYAETMSNRNPSVLGVWGKHGTRAIAAESYWKLPLKWNREAEAEGQRKRVFCASLADVFEGRDTMPESAWDAVDDARLRLFELIDKTPFLDWLLLTKRPDNVHHVMQEVTLGTYGEAWNFLEHMPNVWIGTTVENQKYADIRIPQLLKIPAKVRFLSVEPLLGQIDLSPYLFAAGDDGEPVPRNEPPLSCLHWIIVGGESGSNARPMHPYWVRLIRNQCKNADVPFLFKQWGSFAPIDFKVINPFVVNLAGQVRRVEEPGPGDCAVYKTNKNVSGRIFEGREWNQLPEVSR